MALRARTRIAVATVLALTGPTLASSLTSAPAAEPAPRKARLATPFAMKGWGYGTRIAGGQLPVASGGATAYERIGCTNRVKQSRTNQVAEVALPGLGTVSGVKTRVWTTRSGGTVSVWARNTLGQVTLSDSPLGTLILDAVSTTARAYHDGTGFRTSTHTDVAKLRFKPPVGRPITLELPRPGAPVVIPGVARLTLAHSWTPKSRNGARAFANGLKVELLPTRTTVRVAHAVAQIGTELTTGSFSGQSSALAGSVLGGVAQVGRTALLKMPCQGTGGEVASRSLAGVDLPGVLSVDAAHSQGMGDRNARRAWGWQKSKVAGVELAGGALRIEGVVGRVAVSRKAGKQGRLTFNTRGTSIGRIVVNGQAQRLPLDQTLEIPGIAKLQPRAVTRLRNGVRVSALRITLLDGTGAVVELGNAQLQIKRVPRR